MQVVATARGFDGTVIREIDEAFDMPGDPFAKRPVLKDGKPSGKFYSPPTWLKPAKSSKAKQEAKPVDENVELV